MITLREFVGTLLEEITKGRLVGDIASARLVKEYEKHQILKAFPIPHLRIQDIEVELQFAVGPNQITGYLFGNEEIQQNLYHKLQGFMESLPEKDPYKEVFDDNERKIWGTELNDQLAKLKIILARPNMDKASMVQALSLAIENSLYDLALRQSGSKLLDDVRRLIKGPSGVQEGERQVLGEAIRRQIKRIVDSVDTLTQEAKVVEELLDLNILITPSELQGLDPSMIQKLKFTIISPDRKLVKSEKDGKEYYIVDRY